MPPSTFVGVLIFFWLVTPGFVFNWLASRRHARDTETTFQEVSRVVVASAAFSTAAALQLLQFHSVLRIAGLGTDVDRLISGDQAYLRTQLGWIAGFLLLQVALACGLAWLTDQAFRWAAADGGVPPPLLHAESAWITPFKRQPQENAAAHAWLRLKSGVEITGRVQVVSHDIPVENRELVLTRPLHLRPQGGKAQELQWQWVVIQGSDIDVFAVKYVRDHVAAKSA